MLDAETKRYIDLAIASLRKELLAALPKAQTFVQNAGHADEADHAGKADFVVMIEGSTNVHIDGMSISVDVPAISELMEEGEGFVLVNGNTGSVALVEGSTNVHIYGSTIAVDNPPPAEGILEPNYFAAPIATLTESNVGDPAVSFNVPCWVVGTATFIEQDSSVHVFFGGAYLELSGSTTYTEPICYINYGYNSGASGFVPQISVGPVIFYLPAGTGIRIRTYSGMPPPTHVTVKLLPCT